MGNAPNTANDKDVKDMKGASAEAKGQMMSMKADAALADQLFGDESESTVTSSLSRKLSTEKEYKEFGADVAKVLYSGQSPFRIEAFFKDLCKDIGKHLDSKQIKKISTHLESKFNLKLTEEK